MPAWSLPARANASRSPPLLEAPGAFAGRDGRIALTLVLCGDRGLEASLYTPEHPGASRSRSSGDPTRRVLLNVLAVLPLRRDATASRSSQRRPRASSRSWCSRAPRSPITLSALGVLLYAIGHLVADAGCCFASRSSSVLRPRGRAVRRRPRRPASIGPFLLVVAAALAGESNRRRTEAVTALDETQAAMAESVREQTAMEERAAIARELHDIVAHHLSVIAVQSETARLTSPKLSADARGRFEAIAATARDALTETRRLLGVLREDVGGEAERAPQPGLDQLPNLSTRRATPARTSASSCRARRPTPGGNRSRRVPHRPGGADQRTAHAPGADVDVEVTYGADVLKLRVRDHGPGPAEEIDRPATASSECGTGRRSPAARSPAVRRRAAASWSTSSFPPTENGA